MSSEKPCPFDAFVSGRAGRFFVVRENEILTARVGQTRLSSASLGQFHNFLRLHTDVFTHHTDNFRELHRLLRTAWRRDRCVEFLVASADPSLEMNIRFDAARAAEELLADESVNRFASLIFLNVTPPADGDFATVHQLATASSMPRVAGLALRVITNANRITRLEQLWLEHAASIDSIVERDRASHLIDRMHLVARAVSACDQDFSDDRIAELEDLKSSDLACYRVIATWFEAARAAIQHESRRATRPGRVRRGPRRKNRRAKILKLAKGYYGVKSREYRIAREGVEKSLKIAFKPRKDAKGEFRKLWIARINAAARLNGISYNDLIAGLKAAGQLPDRKTLAELAVRDSREFTKLAKHAQASLKRLGREAKPS